MGVIFDSSLLVSAERRKHTVREIFAQFREAHGETTAGLSAVTLAELAHGIERAKLDAHRARSQAFLDDLLADMIFGRQALRVFALPSEDLLIGSTALYHGFEVVTQNVRHFEMIPDLVVKTL